MMKIRLGMFMDALAKLEKLTILEKHEILKV